MLPRLEADIRSVSSPTAQEFAYSEENAYLRLSVSQQDRLAIGIIVRIVLDRPVAEIPAQGGWCLNQQDQIPVNEALIVEKM